MPVKAVVGLHRTLLLVLLLFLVLFLRSFRSGAVAQESHFLIWVFDQSLRDSQFGYYDGITIQALDPIYAGADIEGLACLNQVIYAAGGRDGRVPSTLNTVVVDIATNTATLSKLADIHTVDGDPFFEVVSLSVRGDGTLWGYADHPPLRGIIQLNPTSGIAELVVPFNRKVEAIAWIDNTLWLAGNNHLYSWVPGGTISHLFDVAGVDQIEALEAIDGVLYAGVHHDNRGVIALDPRTGAIVAGQGFPAPDDIEGVTFCPLQPEPTPTPTATDTPTAISTDTPTATSTATATVTPTSTEQSSSGQSPPDTPTPTLTNTATPTATPTEIEVPLPQPPTALDPTDEPTRPELTRVYLPLILLVEGDSTQTLVQTPFPPPEQLRLTAYADWLMLEWIYTVAGVPVNYTLYRSESESWDEAVAVQAWIQATTGNGDPVIAYYTLIDPTVQPGQVYTYWLTITDLQSHSATFGPLTLAAGDNAQQPPHHSFLPLLMGGG